MAFVSLLLYLIENLFENVKCKVHNLGTIIFVKIIMVYNYNILSAHFYDTC